MIGYANILIIILIKKQTKKCDLLLRFV